MCTWVSHPEHHTAEDGLEALALVGAALPSVFGNVDPRGGRPERVQHEGNSRLVYAGQASHADVEGLDCLLESGRSFVPMWVGHCPAKQH